MELLEEKIRFALRTLKPMAAHTFPFVCQIMGTNDGRAGELWGSGFRCILNGQKSIVSAAHVLSQGRSSFRELAVSIDDGQPPHRLPGLFRSDPVADLAILTPENGGTTSNATSYWPEHRIDPSLDRLSTDYLFVHGFPGLRSRALPIPGDSRVMSRSLPYGAMQRLENLPDDLEEFQFAMDFEPENARGEGGKLESDLSEESIGPRGMSGSPVWRIGVSGRRAADWEPAWCELVGIVTQWRPREKLLIATKATKLLDLVYSNPEPAGGARPE